MKKWSLNEPLTRFLQWLTLLWFLTLFAGWVELHILHVPGGDWYPLFIRSVRFTDFTIFQARFHYFHQLQFFSMAGFPFNYPAPVALVFEGFYRFGAHALDAYLSFCFLAFAGAGFVLGRAMCRRGLGKVQTIIFIGLSLLFSYPFWFLVDRANIEMVNWLLVALGVTAYWKKRWYLAATFIGVAISFKIFPLVFLGLLLSARKYKAMGLAVFVSAITTVTSDWLLGPTYRIASAGIASGLNYFRVQYMLQVHASEIGFDHSLFAIVKELTFKRHAAQEVHYLPWLNGYMVVAAAVGILIYFWKIRTLPRANQILALTVASILLPPVSSDYTLVHLYVPWAVLVLISISLKDAGKVPGLIASFLCMAFLMAPESSAVVHGIRVAGQLKAIVLVILFSLSLTHPFEDPASESGDAQFSESSQHDTVLPAAEPMVP